MPYQSPPKQELWRGWLRACIERLWLSYDAVNYEFLGNALRPPAIDISPTLTAFGRWDPSTRTIAIGLRHVESDPWLAVIETLKHEMAHQFVDEVLGHNDLTAHGKAWQDVCRRLGAEPRATAPRTSSGVVKDEDPRLRRIRKLLALGENNPNEHEVQAALAQAQTLMLRYNIDVNAMRQDKQQPVVRWVGDPSARVESHRYRVSSILDEFFFVRAVWVPTYLPERNMAASQLELCGEMANVEMAEYIHDTLLRQLRALWDQYRMARHPPVKGVRARNSYYYGVLTGFASQLGKKRCQSQEQGLIWVRDARVEELFKRRHPRICTRSSNARLDLGVSLDGERAGRDLRIARPINAHGQAVQGYLPERRSRS